MNLEILYLIAYFYPQTVITIVAHNELANINLDFKSNLLLKLSVKQLMKFLAYDRLGEFQIIKNEITFVPGIIRPDIYCPLPTIPPIFHIIALLHEYNLCTHNEAMLYAMKYREVFLRFNIWGEDKCESERTFKSVLTYKKVVKNIILRAKRRARTSLTNKLIDHKFYAFLSVKGHYDWHLFHA